MGTPMAFPGSVETRKGAASCLLQASFAAPRRAARAASGKGEVRDLDLRRDLIDVRVVHGPRPALRVAPRVSGGSRGPARWRKEAGNSSRSFGVQRWLSPRGVDLLRSLRYTCSHVRRADGPPSVPINQKGKHQHAHSWEAAMLLRTCCAAQL